MAGSRHQRQAGFSLLEFLICLVLASLLISLLVQAQGFVFHSWHSGDERLQQQRRLAHGLRTMLRQVASAAPFTPPGGSPRELAFSGQADGLSFASGQSLGGGAEPGLWLVQYRLVGSGKGVSLQARQWPAGRLAWGSLGAARAEPVVLLAGLAEARFAYLGLAHGDRQRWQESWSGPSLPLAVRLEFSTAAGRQVWLLPVPCGGEPWR